MLLTLLIFVCLYQIYRGLYVVISEYQQQGVFTKMVALGLIANSDCRIYLVVCEYE